MTIGLLAYHSACNYGASLQLLSTFCYLRSHGFSPVIINWVNYELEKQYEQSASLEQRMMMQEFRDNYWHESRICRTSEDVANIIKELRIDAVIVGSDAVAQHHPALERLVFPCKRIVAFRHVTPDRLFPNPFWGEFNNYLEVPIPIAVISASSQDSSYKLIPLLVQKRMKRAIDSYNYLSVRDDWTQKMMVYISKGKITPKITPDPVFAFNQNSGYLLPSRDTIIQRYNLPENYLLFSFKHLRSPQQLWIDSFKRIAHDKGLFCVNIPFSDSLSEGFFDISIPHPISPLDWFALIKYSNGYIGNNMHPIIVALHNAVPFYSFDNYGQYKNRRKEATDDASSKIRHILSEAGFLSNRTFAMSRRFSPPEPGVVLDAIRKFDVEKAQSFSEVQYNRYCQMMDDVINHLFNN